jgi:hypothetical protein
MSTLGKGRNFVTIAGQTRPIGYWQNDWRVPASSPVHRHFHGALNILEAAERAAKERGNLGRDERSWEVERRVRLARDHQMMLKRAAGEVDALRVMARSERERLRGFDFAPAGAAMRSEIRNKLAALPNAEKERLLADPRVAEAVAELPAVFSGLTDVRWQRLHDEALQARHADRLAELADTEEAGALAEAAIGAARDYVENSVDPVDATILHEAME